MKNPLRFLEHCARIFLQKEFILWLENAPAFSDYVNINPPWKRTFSGSTVSFPRFPYEKTASADGIRRFTDRISRRAPSKFPSRSLFLFSLRSAPPSFLRITSCRICLAEFDRKSFAKSSFFRFCFGTSFRSTPFACSLFVALLYHVFVSCQDLF